MSLHKYYIGDCSAFCNTRFRIGEYACGCGHAAISAALRVSLLPAARAYLRARHL